MKTFSRIVVVLLAFWVIVGWSHASEYCRKQRVNPLQVGEVITTIYWSDADSGRANGVCFRMKDVDGAETGPVGSRGGAKCEAERVIGFKSKEDVKNYTKGKKMVVIATFGFDDFDRQLVSYDVNGRDLKDAGIREGFYRSWIFIDGRPTHRKPEYCLD